MTIKQVFLVSLLFKKVKMTGEVRLFEGGGAYLLFCPRGWALIRGAYWSVGANPRKYGIIEKGVGGGVGGGWHTFPVNIDKFGLFYFREFATNFLKLDRLAKFGTINRFN